MPDLIPCGIVTAIALKKSASSQIGRAFRAQQWDPIHFPENDRYRRPHYVTAIRNPGLRLVSCWHHLVANRIAPNVDPKFEHKFGPAVPFPEWIEWVLEHDPLTINNHIMRQTLDLANTLHELPEGLIFIAMLEKLQDTAKGALSTWLKRSMSIPHIRKRGYAPWPTHFEREQLRHVRLAYSSDWHLWFSLYEKGYQVVNSKHLAKYLDLTNGIDRSIMP